MKLAGRTRENRPRAGRLGPAAREPEQPAAQNVAREMLLRDARLAALPATTELVQVRKQDFAEHRLEPERREQAVEGRVRGRLVEPVERRLQFGPRLSKARPVGCSLDRRAPGSAAARRAASAAESPVPRWRCIDWTRASSALE